ncbi:MAG: folate family ECF transporter S component [Erysipelothrix sp.]|nr:folate family ECF transporter S component [Erysipelothrix sp.]
MLNTRNLVRYALMIVIQVLLTQFVGITNTFLRITFTFLGMAWVGYFNGWRAGLFIAVSADLIGMILYPKGPYIVGFTISAACSALIYSLLYQKNKDTKKWVLVTTVLDNLIVNLLMNTAWLVLFMGQSMSVIFWPRLIKTLIAIPVMYISTLALMEFMKKNQSRFK